MISEADVAFYQQHGYLVVQDVLSRSEVEDLRRVTDELVEKARDVSAHDDIYDLEDGHSAAQPRVRRIKTPHLWHPAYADTVRHPNILQVLKTLWGPSIRFDVSKLNLKAAGYGAPVEWHQDWAFYPHTNDDLAAVGIMIDDVDETNGPLMVIPGSHKGPIFDHHEGGVFCGAMDPARGEVDFSSAVKLMGPAGSITVHHVRTVHGSATNTSGKPRRLLLHQYRAADAWPLVAVRQDFDDFWSKLLCGEDTLEPRAWSGCRCACRCRRRRTRARSTRTSGPAALVFSGPPASSKARARAEPLGADIAWADCAAPMVDKVVDRSALRRARNGHRSGDS